MPLTAENENTSSPSTVFCIDWLLGSKYAGLPMPGSLRTARVKKALLPWLSPPQTITNQYAPAKTPEQNSPLKTLTKFTSVNTESIRISITITIKYVRKV
jgi:hypothetical protein